MMVQLCSRFKEDMIAGLTKPKTKVHIIQRHRKFHREPACPPECLPRDHHAGCRHCTHPADSRSTVHIARILILPANHHTACKTHDSDDNPGRLDSFVRIQKLRADCADLLPHTLRQQPLNPVRCLNRHIIVHQNHVVARGLPDSFVDDRRKMEPFFPVPDNPDRELPVEPFLQCVIKRKGFRFTRIVFDNDDLQSLPGCQAAD